MVLLIIYFLIFSLYHSVLSQDNDNFGLTDYSPIHAAMKFFDQMLQPENCQGSEYLVVDMGCGGGFAAHFQLAASEWLRVAASINYSKPVLIVGPIIGYSQGSQCKEKNYDWTCYFLPMSSCQDELITTGKRIDPKQLPSIDENIIPPQFKYLGLPFWWGAVQLRMFRFQPLVKQYVIQEMNNMDGGRGFPFGSLIAGIHVRHGDKKSDGFREHSFLAEMKAVTHSPDCLVVSESSSSSFSSSPTTTSTSSLSIPTSPYLHPHFEISSLCDFFNSSSSTSSSSSSLNPPIENNQEEDSSSSSSSTSTSTSSSSSSSPQRLPIFVASDDPNVLDSARRMGHLVDSSGVSQQTSNAGMFLSLKSHPEMGYNASLEIITDIYFLSHCSTLIGIAASQVYRMAVAMSNASGLLSYACAMDYDQLPRIRGMSHKYGLPLPETFEKP